jgi:hypothetical protein
MSNGHAIQHNGWLVSYPPSAPKLAVLPAHILLISTLALALAACGDDSSQPEPEVEPQPTRCTSSAGCDEGLVCRNAVCTEATECSQNDDCESRELCGDDGLCAFDPEACAVDASCELGSICEDRRCRPGCRTSSECPSDERCNDDLVCELRPCTDLGCDNGYECNAETGACDLLPCNGGCEAPLQCRESDDRCVSCLAHEECELGQSCTAEGVCAEDPCDGHDSCVEGTYCIDGLCRLPDPCDDDELEENDELEAANELPVGTVDDLVACPFDDDYYQLVVDAGRSMTVALDVPDESAALDVEIFNTVGVLFGRREDVTGSDSVTVNVGATTGRYTVRVSHTGDTVEATPYTMTLASGPEIVVAPDLCVPDSFEPNDDSASAFELFDGRWTGLTVCADESDYYRVRAEGGELLTACLAPDPLRGETLGLEVLFASGEVLLSDAGAEAFCLENDLLQGDDYRIHVFATTDGAETPYHLTLTVDEGCRLFEDDLDIRDKNDFIPLEGEDPLEVVPESALPAEFRVCPGDSDYFPIELVAGERLTASIDFVHADGNLDLRLHRPNGTVVLASAGSGDRESFTHEALETGTYYLRVYGVGRAKGAYTLDYQVESD